MPARSMARTASRLPGDGLERLIGLLIIRVHAAIVRTAAAVTAGASHRPAHGGNLSRTALRGGCSRGRTSGGARDQGTHGLEQIRDRAVLDGDHFQFVIRLRRHVHLLDQIEHALDVGGVIANHEYLVGVYGDNAGRVLGERGEELRHFGWFGGLQLHDVRSPLFSIRILAVFEFGNGRPVLRRLGRGNGFHKSFPLVDHGDIVQGQRAVERLHRLGASQGRRRDDGDGYVRQRSGPQHGSSCDFGIFLKDLIDGRIIEFEGVFRAFRLPRTGQVGDRRQGRC